MKRSRDKIALAYDDAGTGAPPLVLVHGWAVDRSVLRPLFDHARTAHRVVAVDLRGHGESDAPVAPTAPYTIAAFADDVALVIAALELDRPLVIGHSMGGLVALDLAARHGDRIAGAAILESMVIAPAAVLAGLRPLLDGIQRDDRDLVARMMRYLAAGCDEPTREQLVRLATSCPQHVLASAMADMLEYDSAAAAARVTCPLLYVSTATPYADLDRLRALCPQLITRQLVGCGHYFPLEAPAQLHPIIDRFLHELAGSFANRAR
jgi:pimeloyl-ACP methyl ester carboxylesterase